MPSTKGAPKVVKQAVAHGGHGIRSADGSAELTAHIEHVHLILKDVVPRVSPQSSCWSGCRRGRVAVCCVLGVLSQAWTSAGARATDRAATGTTELPAEQATGRETSPGASRDLAASKQAYAEGLRAYNLGKWEQAAASFARAYELSGDAALLFNVGQAQRFAGNVKAAIIAYKAFLREQPTAPNRPMVEAKIRELESEPPPIRAPIAAEPTAVKNEPGAPSELPMTAPLPASETAGDPQNASGPTLRLSPPIAESSPAPLVTSTPVQDIHPAPAVHTRWWVWSSVAAVVVAVAVTAVVLSMGGSKRDLSCGPGVDKCTTGGF